MSKSIALAALCSVSSAAGVLNIAAPASAQPPDQIYEFTVLSDTLQTPSVCDTEGEGPFGPCTFAEGPAPYKLATLTLTHDALTHHVAQWVEGCNAGSGQGSDCTPQVDDRRVVSFAGPLPPEPSNPLNVPLDPFLQSQQKFWNSGNGFIFDLRVVGNHLSGTIRIDILPPESNFLCGLKMTGNNNNWAGTWTCNEAFLGPLHSFTAISTRVTSPVAQK